MKSIAKFQQKILVTMFSVICMSTYAADNKEETVRVKEVVIPLSGSEIKQHASGPKRGESMKQVETKYGKAVKVHPTTGNPPITRWDYPNFSVYFESSFVIHTVSHK